ncbi:fumarylacetoacetate hydrolase family protein [Lacticaseibacillus saniviri]|uniref:Fumarylacetoacetase-like C-terminal domain-containing protein n=1 Tax=Lacticaseibacillus saniviri JCM 17471 = DSM 24301 TaxID=1293598 RepID=A0A0R2MX23_9LACO|nr:hypothetical protein IV56_GL001868 [Lacticaseibacillus saniviri JCM 17471 = DSM 24301]
MKLGMYHNQVVAITVEGDTVVGQIVQSAATVFEVIENGLAHYTLEAAHPLDMAALQMPIPVPTQVFAVGMNYRDHSQEIHIQLPEVPSIFTKFQTSLAAPNVTVKRHGDKTDWETELVIVIGRGGRDITKADALTHVAGYMIGQDLSDRAVQFANATPQFSMGKSFENYGPMGPWVTTPDEISELGQLQIETRVNDQVMQHATLDQMIFDVPTLISYVSSVTELVAGDVIFTGTPSGVGVGRDPQQFLQPGDKLVSAIDQLGSLNITIQD